MEQFLVIWGVFILFLGPVWIIEISIFYWNFPKRAINKTKQQDNLEGLGMFLI